METRHRASKQRCGTMLGRQVVDRGARRLATLLPVIGGRCGDHDLLLGLPPAATLCATIALESGRFGGEFFVV